MRSNPGEKVMFAKFLIPVLVLAAGCAVKPADKVAHGQDHNLIAKDALLGRPLADVASSEKIETGLPLARASLSPEIAALAAKVDGGDRLLFDISESYVTVSRVEAGGEQPLVQFAIKGHYDLTNQADSAGVKSQFLVKDDSANARWQDRAYVEVDAAQPLMLKADDATLRNLYAVDKLKNATVKFESAKSLPGLSPADVAEVIATFGLKAGDILETTLSRRFLTILKVEADGTRTVLAQAPVAYYDLARKKNDKEEMTPEIVRNQDQADWSVRAYVAIDSDAAVIAKSSAQLMEHLHEKASFAGKTVELGDASAPLLRDTVGLAQILAQSAISVTLKDKVTYRVTEKAVDVMRGKDVILKYAVLGHVDIAPEINQFGETTAVLKHNTSNRAWHLRKYVIVDARDAEVASRSWSIVENSFAMLERDAVKGQCVEIEKLPLKAMIADVKGQMLPGEEGAKACIEVSQTVVSIFLDILGKRRLVLTYDVTANYDMAQAVSWDGTEKDAVITKNQENPRWDQRAYLDLAVSTPHPVKDEVAPNALSKAMLDGEFLYTAVVTAAHSENGLVFTGWQLQSPDRLKFEVDAGTVTAYKVNEKLNDSGAKSPVLRYSSSTFDIQRAKNGYGDETHVIEENHEKPWQQRKNLRVDFGSNQIISYFNDLLGLEKYYYGVVMSAQSRTVGDLKVEGDAISFETEEVVTPNFREGFSGSGETHFEPVAVRIRHTLLKLGARKYAAKEYSAIDFAKFGYFETTDAGLDPLLGKTDDTMKHLIRRFDIADGKHIEYSLSPGYPEKYKAVTRKVIAAWNEAFKAATGRDDVITLDESGTKDPHDPRNSTIVFVDQRHTSEPLGYGPSVFDPTTGENISGKAYVYKDSIRLVMNMASDFYDLATGARTVDDFATASSPRGADGAAASSRLLATSPLSRALPKTRAEAQRFTRATPVPFKLGETMSKLRSQASLAPAALNSEATTVFDQLSGELKARLGLVGRISAQHRFQGCAMDPEAHIASAMKFIKNHPGMTKDQVLASLEESMMFSLLLHEVGHTLGLRHNFHGSFDEQSFSPKYFEAKADGGWTEKYRTSSTMDYLDDFEATDLAAGSYDVAALKFGYADKLEKVIGVDEFGALITEDMPKAEFDAELADLKAAHPTASMDSLNATAMRNLDVRPYLFCTDEHTEDDPTCNRFDRGVTVEELTNSLIEEYDTRYQLYGFRRGRRDFTGSSSSVIGRYILPVRRLLDEYVYNVINGTFRSDDNFDGSPNPGSPQDYINAIFAGIDFYDKILATVEPGDYHLDAKTGELVTGRSDEEGAKNVVVDLKTGKYLDARVQFEGGHEERVLNRGIELDKIGVVFAMGMRGYPAAKYERAQLAVNYFDILKESTLDRFSRVIREDLKPELVSVLGEDGSYHPVTDPEFVFDEANPAHLKAKIPASSSLAIREYATIFATGFDNAGNRTFGDYVDYRLQGIDAAFPAGATTAEFTSVSGLKTYVVANTADSRSISFQIAKKAQETSAKILAAKEALASAPSNAEVKAAAIAKFGEAWALGTGSPMGQDIVEILEGNFEPNLPIVRLMTEGWLASAEDPDQIAALTKAKDELFAILDQYEALAATLKELEDAIEDGQRDLTGFETDLIHLKDMYAIFK